MSKTTLHLSKQLSRIRIMANYWHLIVRRCEIGVCGFHLRITGIGGDRRPEWLKKRYATLASKLNGTAFGAPVYIESDDRDGMMRGEVPGLEKCGEAQPGEDVQKLLAVAVPAMDRPHRAGRAHWSCTPVARGRWSMPSASSPKTRYSISFGIRFAGA